MKKYSALAITACVVLFTACNNTDGNNSTSPCATGSASCSLNGGGTSGSGTSGSGSSGGGSGGGTTSSGPIVDKSSFSPAGGATGVSTVGTTITVNVQGGVDETSLAFDAGTLDTVWLTNSAGVKMPINVVPSATGFTIQTQGCSLYPGMSYTVTVSGISNNSKQTLSGSVSSSFSTNSSYSKPACEDPVLGWTPPTTGSGESLLTPDPSGGQPTTSVTGYQIYYVQGTCNDSTTIDQTPDNQSVAITTGPTATGQQKYTLSERLPLGQNIRFGVKACVGASCSSLSSEVCKQMPSGIGPNGS